jgi:hypothetical protein
MLDTLRVRREDHGLFRTDDGGRRLQKHQRLLGNFVAEFGGVRGIVAADANDFAGINRRHKAHCGERPRAGRLRPLSPRYAGDFPHLVRIEDGVKWSSRRDSAVRRNKAAEFHAGSAHVVVCFEC